MLCRFYEKKGVISARKKENGYRYYSEDDIYKLMYILYHRKMNTSLEDIEELSLSNQYRLFQLIRFRTGDWEPSGTKPFKLRITGSTSLKPEEFAERMEVGSFRPDLYYLLSGWCFLFPL